MIVLALLAQVAMLAEGKPVVNTGPDEKACARAVLASHQEAAPRSFEIEFSRAPADLPVRSVAYEVVIEDRSGQYERWIGRCELASGDAVASRAGPWP